MRHRDRRQIVVRWLTVSTARLRPRAYHSAVKRPQPAVGTLRILFLQDHLLENGGLRVVHDLVRRLRNDAVQATMFVLRGHADGQQFTPAPDVDVVYAVRRRLALRWSILVGVAPLIRQSRRHDVIVSGSEIGFMLLLGWSVARLVGKPFVVLVQSPLQDAISAWVPGPLQSVTRRVNAKADAAVCVSPGLTQGVIDNGLPPEHLFTMSVGVDVDDIIARAGQSSTVATPTGRYIVAAGRLDEQKGFDVLIRAHAKVLRNGARHGLVIVGEGASRTALTDLTNSLDVGASVMMPGFVENLHPLIARADLFVLSSRREGMGGLVLLEALAHGTPIIATDCPTGPRELLEGGRLGGLVAVDNADELADAILSYFTDPSELRRRATGGPRRVLDFDPGRAALEFAEILRHVVEQHRDARRRPTPAEL